MIRLLLLLLLQEDPIEWNRRGIERLEKGEIPGAIEAFEKARSLRPEDATIRKNLAVARFREAERALAAKEAEKAVLALRAAVELAPDFPRYRVFLAAAERAAGREEKAREICEETAKRFPAEAGAHELLGHLHHRQGRLEEALAAFERAIAADPKRPGLRESAERVRRDLALESGYARAGSIHFDFRFDGARRDLERGAGVLAQLLDDAWEAVAGELREYPAERLQVVLYAGDAFREVTGSGEWVGGLFDGRIRVPVGPIFRQREALAPVLRHEVSHAFLHRMAPALPSWASEGLAQRIEGREPSAATAAARAARERLHGAGELRAPFLELKDPARIRLAYAQSLSLVDWLERARGREALLRYARGIAASGEEKAFAEAFGFSFADALALWREDLGP